MSTPNPWFRHYVGMVADPKFGGIARRAQATRERVVFVWSCILESASHINDGGRFFLDIDAIADLLHCENDAIDAILAQLEATGLTVEGFVAKWNSRQCFSDNSTERSRRHRSKKRESTPENDSGNGDATLHNRCGNGEGTACNESATAPKSKSKSESKSETETKEINTKVVVSVSGGVGETTTDGGFFFALTPERMAVAQRRGFSDASWVQAQTERFIERNNGKHLNCPEAAWLNWLNAGKERGIGFPKPLAGPVSYLESRAAAGRIRV